MKTTFALVALTWSNLWFTPDQQGQRLFEREDYVAAAQAFQDPLWQGTAWYRAGEFERAAQAFARRNTPEALFNQGNAWLMRGEYEAAIAAYDQALGQRPEWQAARENRALAAARAERVESKGGDMGEQTIGADEIVFDKGQENTGGQDTEIAADQALSEKEFQALWLRQVTTKPADFLKAKFAYQHQFGANRGEE